MSQSVIILSLMALVLGLRLNGGEAGRPPVSASPAVQELAQEVRGNGWLGYAARSEGGDWDLFVCRPDGSAIRHLTRTPACSEFSPQFSRDGRKLLYRRMPPQEKLDNNRHGE